MLSLVILRAMELGEKPRSPSTPKSLEKCLVQRGKRKNEKIICEAKKVSGLCRATQQNHTCGYYYCG